MKRRVFKLLALLFGVIAIVFGGMTAYSLKDDFFEWWDSRRLQQQFTSEATASESASAASGTSGADSKQTTSKAPAVRLTLDQMRAANGDTVGLVSIPYFDLYYPVVQADDNEYYLTRSFTNRNSKNGAIFLDHRNKLTEPHQNFIVYGHNNKNNLMFAKLVRYNPFTGLTAYKRAPAVTFQTFEGHRDWKIFAICVFNSNEANGNVFAYLRSTFPTEEIFNSYTAEIQARNMLSGVDVDLQYGDTLLTLSTCTYDFKDARIVVFARAVREGESTAVDTSKVVVNKAAVMPDAYVEKKGMGVRESEYLRTKEAEAVQAVSEESESVPSEG